MGERKPRTSAREIAAREAVRARRASVWERERKLEDLATDYVATGVEIKAINDQTEERIATYVERIRRDGDNRKASLQDRQASCVQEMLELEGIRTVAALIDEPQDVVKELRGRLAPRKSPARAEGGQLPVSAGESSFASDTGPAGSAVAPSPESPGAA